MGPEKISQKDRGSRMEINDLDTKDLLARPQPAHVLLAFCVWWLIVLLVIAGSARALHKAMLVGQLLEAQCGGDTTEKDTVRKTVDSAYRGGVAGRLTASRSALVALAVLASFAWALAWASSTRDVWQRSGVYSRKALVLVVFATPLAFLGAVRKLRDVKDYGTGTPAENEALAGVTRDAVVKYTVPLVVALVGFGGLTALLHGLGWPVEPRAGMAFMVACLAVLAACATMLGGLIKVRVHLREASAKYESLCGAANKALIALLDGAGEGGADLRAHLARLVRSQSEGKVDLASSEVLLKNYRDSLYMYVAHGHGRELAGVDSTVDQQALTAFQAAMADLRAFDAYPRDVKAFFTVTSATVWGLAGTGLFCVYHGAYKGNKGMVTAISVASIAVVMCIGLLSAWTSGIWGWA